MPPARERGPKGRGSDIQRTPPSSGRLRHITKRVAQAVMGLGQEVRLRCRPVSENVVRVGGGGKLKRVCSTRFGLQSWSGLSAVPISAQCLPLVGRLQRGNSYRGWGEGAKHGLRTF